MNLPTYFTRTYFSACREVLGVMTLHEVLHRSGLEPYIQAPPHYLSSEDFAAFNWGIDQVNPQLNRQIGQLVARDLFQDHTLSLQMLPQVLEMAAVISIIDQTIVFDFCPACFDLPPDPNRDTGFCMFWVGLLETLLNTQVSESSCCFRAQEVCRFEVSGTVPSK